MDNGIDIISDWIKQIAKWEELADEVRDKQYMIDQMVAEMHLCERLYVEKEYLINHMRYLNGDKLI